MTARIDTHRHLMPPAYRRMLDDRGLTAGVGHPGLVTGIGDRPHAPLGNRNRDPLLSAPARHRRVWGEIGRVFDELNADGVVLVSNAQGKCLGHNDFEPTWVELDSRAAVQPRHRTRGQVDSAVTQ
ncbi:hypothetical protein [Rhodococcus wratislaviensis]|uniref:hypothetical protein n=1 Tax=Rhodococcus wratislaviensis TaxID=44752 RepID=UPI003512E250